MLKQAITSTRILVTLDVGKSFVIEYNTSSSSIGAVLLQDQYKKKEKKYTTSNNARVCPWLNKSTYSFLLNAIHILCKTQVFRLIVLVSVQFGAKSIYTLGPFSHMHMYDVYLRAMALVSPNARCHLIGHHATRTLAFNFILSRV